MWSVENIGKRIWEKHHVMHALDIQFVITRRHSAQPNMPASINSFHSIPVKKYITLYNLFCSHLGMFHVKHDGKIFLLHPTLIFFIYLISLLPLILIYHDCLRRYLRKAFQAHTPLPPSHAQFFKWNSL